KTLHKRKTPLQRHRSDLVRTRSLNIDARKTGYTISDERPSRQRGCPLALTPRPGDSWYNDGDPSPPDVFDRKGPTMSTAIATPTEYTLEDLLALPDEKSFELVDGHLVEQKSGAESSWVGGEVHQFFFTACLHCARFFAE